MIYIYIHICLYIYICVYTYIYIYIYIGREREREREMYVREARVPHFLRSLDIGILFGSGGSVLAHSLRVNNDNNNNDNNNNDSSIVKVLLTVILLIVQSIGIPIGNYTIVETILLKQPPYCANSLL